MNEELVKLELEILVVDHKVDHSILRELDQQVNGKYYVVVANDKTAMRGLDYRSKSVRMALVIAKSFENQREAIQGYNRVGRYDDSCIRI